MQIFFAIIVKMPTDKMTFSQDHSLLILFQNDIKPLIQRLHFIKERFELINIQFSICPYTTAQI